MPLHRVKLKSDAFEKAQGQDVNVGFLESEERFESERADDGTFQVRKRELDRLRQYDLIEDVEVDPMAQARNAEDEDDVDHRNRRVARTRSEGVVSAVHPGGVGHQPNDNFSNRRLNEETQREQERGLAQQQERGLPTVESTIPEQVNFHEHRLPEQRKAFKEAEEKRDKDLEKARKEGEKERDKARKEHERDNAKAEKEQEKRAEAERKGDVDPEGQVREAENKQAEGASQQEQERRDKTEDRGQNAGAERDSGDDSRQGTKSGPKKGR